VGVLSLRAYRSRAREGASRMTWRRRKRSTVLSYGPLKYSVVKGFGRMSSGVEIVIAGAVRTPLGKFGGSLSSLSAPDLGAVAARRRTLRVQNGTPAGHRRHVPGRVSVPAVRAGHG